MEKVYILITFLLVSSFGLSQTQDTIYSHFTGSSIYYIFAADDYLTGTNSYGDLAKLQYMSQSNELPNQGYLTHALLFLPYVSNSQGSFDVIIWNGTSTSISDTLASVTVSIQDVYNQITNIDTIQGALSSNDTAVYNYIVEFDPPLSAPEQFWIGVGLPDTAGDSVVVASTEMGNVGYSGDYCGEIWSDGTFSSMPAAWGSTVNIALAIFPVYTSSLASVQGEGLSNSFSVYPTISSSHIFLRNSDNLVKHATLMSISGEVLGSYVLDSEEKRVDVSSLNSGIYFILVKDQNGNVLGSERFIKE